MLQIPRVLRQPPATGTLWGRLCQQNVNDIASRIREQVSLEGTTVVICSHLPAQADHPRAQDSIQTIPESLQWWRLLTISGQPVPVPSHSHRKVLPHVQVDFPVHHFLLLASCPISWQHQEEPCKSSAHFHEVMTSWEHVRNALLLGHFPQECHSQGRAAMRTNSTPGATLRLVSTVHVQEWGHHAAQDQQPWKSQPRTAGNGWGQRTHN